MKSFNRPPVKVAIICSALAYVFTSKEEHLNMEKGWKEFKKLSADANFVKRLFTYDIKNTDQKKIPKLEKFL